MGTKDFLTKTNKRTATKTPAAGRPKHVAKNVEETKQFRRIVDKKIPRQILKVNIKKFTEQLNVQNLLHSLNKPTPRNARIESSFDDSMKGVNPQNPQSKIFNRMTGIEIKDFDEGDDNSAEPDSVSQSGIDTGKAFKNDLKLKVYESSEGNVSFQKNEYEEDFN